jgi:hypothetical protein
MKSCTQCGKDLSGAERPFLWQGKLVCITCRAELSHKNNRAYSPPPDDERCGMCLRFIGPHEQLYLRKERVLCSGCWSRVQVVSNIRARAEAAGFSPPPMGEEPLPGGISAGSLLINASAGSHWRTLNPPPQPKPFLSPVLLYQKAFNRLSELKERDFVDIEIAGLTEDPFGPQRHLLYALRMSKTVEKLVNALPLANNWGSAMYGAERIAGKGGISAVLDDLSRPILTFLISLYAWKFQHIIEERINKADVSAQKKKKPEAWIVIWQKAVEDIGQWPGLFVPFLPGADAITLAATESLQGRIRAVEAEVNNGKV